MRSHLLPFSAYWVRWFMQPAVPQSILRSVVADDTTRLRSGTKLHTILPSGAVDEIGGAGVAMLAAAVTRGGTPLGRSTNTTTAPAIINAPMTHAQTAWRRKACASSRPPAPTPI